MKQLHNFYNLFIKLKCYPQCGVNSHISVSSLCSQMKREESSPKKHFLSRHNSEYPKSCSSSCWLHESQRTGCTVWKGFSPFCSTSSSCWHSPSPERASKIGEGSKSRWHWAEFASPLPLEEFFCASKNSLLYPQACSLPTLRGQGSSEHPNQGPGASTLTSVDLVQTLPLAPERSSWQIK